MTPTKSRDAKGRDAKGRDPKPAAHDPALWRPFAGALACAAIGALLLVLAQCGGPGGKTGPRAQTSVVPPGGAQGPSAGTAASDLVAKCAEPGKTYPNGPPGCVYDAFGNVVSRQERLAPVHQEPPVPPRPVTTQAGGIVASDGFAAFRSLLAFALVWSALPMVLAASIASQRDQNVLVAVALALVLGWLGLLVVAIVMRPAVMDRGRRVVDRVAQAPGPPDTPATRDSREGDPPDSAERLRSLAKLRDEGLITESEYSERRRRILEQI